MMKKSYIIQNKENKNVWACLNLDLAEQVIKDLGEDYSIVEEYPHNKAYLVSYKNARGFMDCKICLTSKSYQHLIDSLITFTSTTLDIWIKGEEVMPEELPKEAIIILQTNGNHEVPLYVALTKEDAIDGIEWIQQNHPEVNPKISEYLIQVHDDRLNFGLI